MHLTSAIRNAQFSVAHFTVADFTDPSKKMVAEFTVAEFSGCPVYRLPVQ